MKRYYVVLFVFIVVLIAQVDAQSKSFGKAPQREIAANYKGEWKVVVGAKGMRPVISLNGGKTTSISPNTVLSFPRKDKVLPIAGEIKLAGRTVNNPYPYPNDNVRSVELKYIPQQDFENLYMVMFVMTKESQLIGIRVEEIGKVKAGKSYDVDYKFVFKEHEKQPDVRFYSKGLEVRVSE